MIHPHTQQIEKGDFYFCLPGGEAYISDAFKKGAKAVIYGDRVKMAHIGNQLYGNPSESLVVMGITGTNGKTTVTHMICEALKKMGKKPAFSGTLNGRLTTPESIETLQKMRAHKDAGGTHYIMEVSSHGIDQGRHLGITYALRCLTNISQDHLDYHGSLEAYRNIKLRFLNEGDSKRINGETLVFTKDIHNPNIKGRFNQENLQLAYACLVAVGEEEGLSRKVLSQISSPPGRYEFIDFGQPFSVIVDYAHTPDGLEKVLSSIKDEGPKRCLTLFGCGGDRDQGKRAKMGRIASRYSDFLMITNDNPRSEDPDKIISDIKDGIPTDQPTEVVLDRGEAIKIILSKAQPGDTILIAGKGHEKTQVLANKTIYFDDREIVRSILKAYDEH